MIDSVFLENLAGVIETWLVDGRDVTDRVYLPEGCDLSLHLRVTPAKNGPRSFHFVMWTPVTPERRISAMVEPAELPDEYFLTHRTWDRDCPPRMRGDLLSMLIAGRDFVHSEPFRLRAIGAVKGH